MITDNPLPKRLKQARLKKRLSQKGLGIAIGIDEFVASARMNQYETGKHSPDFSILKRIAKILQVPTAYFYAEDERLAEILKIYARITKSEQKELLILAKNFQISDVD